MTSPLRTGSTEAFVPPAGGGARLWLARHAEVAEEWRGRAYGDLDVPLSPEGEARTRELAADLALLHPSRVLSSPLQRARRLGEAVAAAAGLELVTDDRLAEIHRGRWQGRGVDELHELEREAVARFYADPWSFREHGGESDEDVARRAWGALGEHLPESGTLVVATHYNVIRVVCATALGIPPARSFAFRVDPGRVVLLVGAPDGWHLHHANVHSSAALAGGSEGAA